MSRGEGYRCATNDTALKIPQKNKKTP